LTVQHKYVFNTTICSAQVCVLFVRQYQQMNTLFTNTVYFEAEPDHSGLSLVFSYCSCCFKQSSISNNAHARM